MNDLIRLQTQVATGRLTLPVTIFICLLFGVFTLHGWQDTAKIASIAFVAYLMIEANTAFTLIRTRTTLPVCIWIFLGTILSFLSPGGRMCLVAPAFMVSVFQLFRSYESASAPANTYNAFLALSLGSLALPPMVWYVPLFLIGMILFRAIGGKSFLGAILGLITPYWFLFGYAFYTGQIESLLFPFHQMAEFHPVNFGQLPREVMVSGAAVTLLQLVFGIHYLQSAYQDKTRTRIYHSFLVYAGWWTTIFCLLQPVHWGALMPVQILCTAFLGGHLFTLTKNRFSGILFVVTFVSLIALTIYNLWMQFFSF